MTTVTAPAKLEEKLQELKDNVGQPVLVSQWEKDSLLYSSTNSAGYGWQEHLDYGVLKELGVEQIGDHRDIEITTGKHLSFNNFGLGSWYVFDGNINLYGFQLARLNKEERLVGDPAHYRIDIPDSLSTRTEIALQILVGEDVVDYFREPIIVEDLPTILEDRKLGWERRNLHVKYLKLMALLGNKVDQLPDEFVETYRKEGLAFLRHLAELEKVTEKIKERIEAKRKMVGKGPYFEGGALTMIDSADDFFFASLGNRQNLEAEVEKIKSAIQGALSLGMHFNDSKLSMGETPGIEATVNLPEYIKHLCEVYKVEIPEIVKLE